MYTIEFVKNNTFWGSSKGGIIIEKIQYNSIFVFHNYQK